MVAYSFKPRFIEPIKIGQKIGTIRAPRSMRSAVWLDRDRHAYPGENLTLLTGPRMKPTHIGMEICAARFSIELRFRPIVEVIIGERRNREKLPLSLLDRFAVEDGFTDFADLERFWHETHAAPETFEGVHILWQLPLYSEAFSDVDRDVA